MAVAAEPELVAVEELEVEVPVEVEVPSVPEAAVVPEVPLAVDPPGRLTVDLAARALKFASVRVALAVGLKTIALDFFPYSKVCKGNLLDVNDHSHSILAMLSLGAVKPHGCRVVDQNGICRSLGGSCCNRHEAREDTGNVGVQGDRLARSIEGRLSDCVVCGRELELHHISHCGCDRVGRVCEGSICVSDLDNVDCGSCCFIAVSDLV
jgi:hypothetical protein